jgi:hypothetical protein
VPIVQDKRWIIDARAIVADKIEANRLFLIESLMDANNARYLSYSKQWERDLKY